MPRLSSAKVSSTKMEPAKMNMERWSAIESPLKSAPELKANYRRAFPDNSYAGVESLRNEMESLIVSRERAGDVTEKIAVEDATILLAREDDSRKTPTLAKDLIRDQQRNVTTLIED